MNLDLAVQFYSQNTKISLFEHDDLNQKSSKFSTMILKILLVFPGTVSAKSSAKSTKPKYQKTRKN